MYFLKITFKKDIISTFCEIMYKVLPNLIIFDIYNLPSIKSSFDVHRKLEDIKEAFQGEQHT